MVKLFPPPFDKSPDAPAARHRPQHDHIATTKAEDRDGRLSTMERLDGYISLLSRCAGPVALIGGLMVIGWLFLR
ncbi:MAG: hypothetical protein QM605_16285 [Sphingobium sp.]